MKLKTLETNICANSYPSLNIIFNALSSSSGEYSCICVNTPLAIISLQLYKLVQNPNYNPDGFVELEFPAGVEVIAFTFG